jgi:hypothetical protein
MRFMDLDKFEIDLTFNTVEKNMHILKDIQMHGITSLDLSPSLSLPFGSVDSRTYTLPSMLPNLRQVDIFNKDISYNFIIEEFSTNCPSLEKLTMHNSRGFCLCGFDLASSNNIKEIYIDNSYFSVVDLDTIFQMEDLNNHQDNFMFCYCCKALERVSIKNM